MQICLAITTFNRLELTIKSFRNVMNDPRLSEILILDDKSTDGSFERLQNHFSEFQKVRVMQQLSNQQMQENKKCAIALSKNPWVCIFDSDNEIDESYLDALEAVGELDPNTFYLPDAALPKFVFSHLAGLTFDRHTVIQYMDDSMFRICLNTCNMVVHRDTYLSHYKFDPEIKATDTLNNNYNHLLAGGKFHIVKGMKYKHLVHDDSGFLKDCDYNMAKAKELEMKIRAL